LESLIHLFVAPPRLSLLTLVGCFLLEASRPCSLRVSSTQSPPSCTATMLRLGLSHRMILSFRKPGLASDRILAVCRTRPGMTFAHSAGQHHQSKCTLLYISLEIYINNIHVFICMTVYGLSAAVHCILRAVHTHGVAPLQEEALNIVCSSTLCS